MEEASKHLQIFNSSLSKWINSAKENNGVDKHRGSGNFSCDSEKEIARLKKELRDSEDALEIFKKAISILKV